MQTESSVRFASKRRIASHHTREQIRLPPGSFPPREKHLGWGDVKTMVPTVPIHLRPKRGLANYHVLWEAEWARIPPIDPMLLRRIGKADMWLAAWDPEVERAALAGRMNG